MTYQQPTGSSNRKLVIGLSVLLAIIIVIIGVLVFILVTKDDSADNTPAATTTDEQTAKNHKPATNGRDVAANSPSDVTRHGRFFQIPAKNVGCEVKNGVLGCTAEVTGQWDCGDGKSSFALNHDTLIGQQCGTKYLGQPGDAVPMLQTGDRWESHGYVCEVLSSSKVSCINRKGDGFTVGNDTYSDQPSIDY